MNLIGDFGQQVLTRVERRLGSGNYCKIDSGRGHLVLHVERLSDTELALAHYSKPDGPDPDGVFELTQDGWILRELTQAFGVYTSANSDRALEQLNRFADNWLKTLAEEQEIL